MTPEESRRDLDPAAVAAALADAGWHGPQPVLLASVDSTNVTAADLVRSGAADGSCVVAEEQTAGRGRLDRTWVSPRGAGLWLSTVVRPTGLPVERRAWLPLIAGLAARDAIRSATRVPVDLKWPNDLVVTAAMCGGSGGTRKLGGILSEVVDEAVVIGIGINVALASAELPTPQATSVYAEGGDIDRTALLAALLPALAARMAQWRDDAEAVRADYRQACVTIGRLVEIQFPGGPALNGVVTGIDDHGHLMVDDGEITQSVTAGDVIHATI